ncbi:MAG: aldehyde dehydrogenase family protein, partial [Acidimicrobiia bacterium]
MAIPAWKMAPALAAGNGVVLKPATAGAGVADALAECIDESPLPAGLVALVMGSGATIGAALLASPHVKGVSFTGSVEVGRTVRVACARRGIRVQTELGGRNPAIVLTDADLPAAAAAVAAGAFGYAGQKCTATRRVLVQDAVYDEFASLLVAAAGAMTPADPLDPATKVGPLISVTAADTVRTAIGEAIDGGADLLHGGADGDGDVVAPTILSGVPAGAALGCDEVFGPVLVLEHCRDLDDAIAAANATPYGLSAGIHTTSLAAAAGFEAGIEAGVIVVNRPTTGVEPHAPFGGLKASGYGWREQGIAALSFYSELQAVYEA